MQHSDYCTTDHILEHQLVQSCKHLRLHRSIGPLFKFANFGASTFAKIWHKQGLGIIWLSVQMSCSLGHHHNLQAPQLEKSWDIHIARFISRMSTKSGVGLSDYLPISADWKLWGYNKLLSSVCGQIVGSQNLVLLCCPLPISRFSCYALYVSLSKTLDPCGGLAKSQARAGLLWGDWQQQKQESFFAHMGSKAMLTRRHAAQQKLHLLIPGHNQPRQGILAVALLFRNIPTIAYTKTYTVQSIKLAFPFHRPTQALRSYAYTLQSLSTIQNFSPRLLLTKCL